MKLIFPKNTNTKPFNFSNYLFETKLWNKMTKFVAITYHPTIMRYDEIEKFWPIGKDPWLGRPIQSAKYRNYTIEKE